MMHIILLMVFSGLTLNFVLHFGMGIRGLLDETISLKSACIKAVNIIISSLLIWFIFTLIMTPLSIRFLQYFLVFPFSALICYGLEKAEAYMSPALAMPGDSDAPSSYGGLGTVQTLLILRIGTHFSGALVLSLGFCFGCFAAMLIINEILKRSAMEAVPRFLRGSPLMLISMGLLSLIFSALAVIIINA
ncbi:hypothetical protein LJC14_06600, partial [Treponema sp. OttesenSCG-928-L16]|nr:hypothetical protein [Treponema sp. OttesenSCG-928-L16]